MTRMKKKYLEEVAPALMEKFQYKSTMQIPKIDKIVINVGCGDAKENSKVIGSLGLEELDPDPVEDERCGREIGYVLSKDYWGKGLMPEAVRAVIEYCFSELKFDYLTCGHFIRNDRSRRVVEKCGFVYFGESQYDTRYDTVETSRNYVLYNPNK